jgi:hypothetical protein
MFPEAHRASDDRVIREARGDEYKANFDVSRRIHLVRHSTRFLSFCTGMCGKRRKTDPFGIRTLATMTLVCPYIYS